MDKTRKYFELKEEFQIREFERKKDLTIMRFDLSVKLAELMDQMASKRHIERCEILGIKYIEENRKPLIEKRVQIGK